MRELPAEVRTRPDRRIAEVVDLEALRRRFDPARTFVVPMRSAAESVLVRHLQAAGASNVIAAASDPALLCDFAEAILLRRMELEVGDVVAVDGRRHSVPVLFRESDCHHTVFITNRCNSYCLMCSQPPTTADDGWLIDEARAIAASISSSPEVIGFSGGEPLLIGGALRSVMDAFLQHHPKTRLEVLTNGRRFADSSLAASILADLPNRVSWMVPLYGHCDFLHDFVVQSPGAFDETLAGLLELQAHGQVIQLRIVLIRPVLEGLGALCEFVGKNLPFVADVALMGCEPIGFARANPEYCRVDYGDWKQQIGDAALQLEAMGVQCHIMNIPQCLLSDEALRFAVDSISDWKRVYAPECAGCTRKGSCAGLFASFERGWRPGVLRPAREMA